ncbi:hypothetical protein ACE7GA_05945 [Roseomonas sp. CCTCC AB2023176]
MRRVRDATAAILDGTTLATLAAAEQSGEFRRMVEEPTILELTKT